MSAKLLIILLATFSVCFSQYQIGVNSPFLLINNFTNIVAVDADLQNCFLVGFQDGSARRYSSDLSSYTSLVVPEVVNQFSSWTIQLNNIVLSNGTIYSMLYNMTTTLSNSLTTLRVYTYPAFTQFQSYNFTEHILDYRGLPLYTFSNLSPFHILVFNFTIKVVYKDIVYTPFNINSTFGVGYYCTSIVYNQYISSSAGNFLNLTYSYYETINSIGLVQVNITLVFKFNFTSSTYDLTTSSNFFISEPLTEEIQTMLIANGVVLMQTQTTYNLLLFGQQMNFNDYVDSYIQQYPILAFFYAYNTYYILFTQGLISAQIDAANSAFIATTLIATLPNNNYKLVFSGALDALYISGHPYIYKSNCLNQSAYQSTCLPYICQVPNCNQCPLTANTCGTCATGYIRTDLYVCSLQIANTTAPAATNTTTTPAATNTTTTPAATNTTTTPAATNTTTTPAATNTTTTPAATNTTTTPAATNTTTTPVATNTTTAPVATNTTTAPAATNTTIVNPTNSTSTNSTSISNSTNSPSNTSTSSNTTNNSANSTSNLNYATVFMFPKYYIVFPLLQTLKWLEQLIWFIINATKTLISIPAARRVSPTFFYFGNFDDLYLYCFHDRLYGNVMNDLFSQLNEIQTKKWSLLSYQTELEFFDVQNESFYSAINYQIAYTTYNFTTPNHPSQGSEAVLANCANFFVITAPIIILGFILLRFLFRLLFQYPISQFLRKFDLWGFLFITLFDGNIQQFAFYTTSDWMNTFYFSLSDKLMKSSIILFGFLLVSISVGGYLIAYSMYRKLNRYLIDNNRNNLKGTAYILLQYGFRNFILGMLHSILRPLPYKSMLLILILAEAAFFVIFLISIALNTYKMAKIIWFYLLLTLIRMMLILTLFFDYQFLNIDLIELIQCSLIILMVAVYLLGTVIVSLSFLAEIGSNVIKICKNNKQALSISVDKVVIINEPLKRDFLSCQILHNNQDAFLVEKIKRKFKNKGKIRTFNIQHAILKIVQVEGGIKPFYKTKTTFK